MTSLPSSPVPDHVLYNPPVEHRSWTMGSSISSAGALLKVQEALTIDAHAMNTIIRHGGLSLNGRRILDALPAQLPAGAEIHVYRFLRDPVDIPLSAHHILWRAHGLIAVNKPAWLPVQGTRVSKIFCLEEALKNMTGISTVMAIHRLDRQTSGIVLFAETAKIAGTMMKQFAARTVHKKYLAVVSPAPVAPTWEVQGYLIRDHRKLPRDCFKLIEQEKPTAKWSHSTFKCLDQKEDIALVESVPITGRTHQLRIHLAHTGIPIVGDTLYGPHKPVIPHCNCRIQLHAAQITFPIIHKGKPDSMTVQAPLPADFIWKS